ncbi:MAG TPA: hypothetical protein DEQ87_08220 [Algoriphagus sp.]|jgi:hypothetical protein|uniref:hypothetical protein n=1 Tax=unclassified Algoriphagus TaxID=2641541 RepID=UPI000C64A2D2|nr:MULTISPECIES: hypothetical protein [unclassified Algoriphagus]MAL12006.1 hypothetical protein [Algoriphagus sp.]QYH38575.1 hypothetical protein GYM62_07110 [Algoriphagus sp. NBT04N3]HAH38576.1 hypothetical protein [Algoriphagus sp.]HAS57065.1 hypothetical protein [Algoriphagus sp.]HAZ24228.1 hypothetical protein [Algoriphagus sp.]|tara:strand:+ start:101 stop:571 length:471 start_codon:yes stop_codon:yes gene_type:complete
MDIPSLATLKKDLGYLSEQEIKDLLIELIKFSRDNKAYLFFKLYERDQPGLFVEMVKEDLLVEFEKARVEHGYYAKKSAQSIRRKMNKLLKLLKSKPDQAEVILFFCEKIKEMGFLKHRNSVIKNLYEIQKGKVEKLVSGLHEDLQYDFQFRLEKL